MLKESGHPYLVLTQVTILLALLNLGILYDHICPPSPRRGTVGMITVRACIHACVRARVRLSVTNLVTTITSLRLHARSPNTPKVYPWNT